MQGYARCLCDARWKGTSAFLRVCSAGFADCINAHVIADCLRKDNLRKLRSFFGTAREHSFIIAIGHVAQAPGIDIERPSGLNLSQLRYHRRQLLSLLMMPSFVLLLYALFRTLRPEYCVRVKSS